MTDPVNLRHFLSDPKAAELELGLSQMAASQASSYIATWDAQTGFALVVEVLSGAPYQWHLRGPLNHEGACLWLAMVQAEINDGAAASRASRSLN